MGTDSFSSLHRSNDSFIYWPDSRWPLIAPHNIQVHRCDKCQREKLEFSSSFNFRRHSKSHRKNTEKEDLKKHRKEIAVFWDQLSCEQAAKILSVAQTSVGAVKGAKTVESFPRFPRHAALVHPNHSYYRAFSLMDAIMKKSGSSTPVTSDELFKALDEASENTFLNLGTSESVVRHISHESDKIIDDEKNTLASYAFLVEENLVKAWNVEKDVESLRHLEELVRQEEDEQLLKEQTQEKKRNKKAKKKGKKSGGASPSDEPPPDGSDPSDKSSFGAADEVVVPEKPDADTTGTGRLPDDEAPEPDAEIHPDAPKPDAEIQPDAPKPDAEIQPDAPKLDAEIQPDAPKPDAEIHPDAPKPDAEVHPDAPKPISVDKAPEKPPETTSVSDKKPGNEKKPRWGDDDEFGSWADEVSDEEKREGGKRSMWTTPKNNNSSWRNKPRQQNRGAPAAPSAHTVWRKSKPGSSRDAATITGRVPQPVGDQAEVDQADRVDQVEPPNDDGRSGEAGVFDQLFPHESGEPAGGARGDDTDGARVELNDADGARDEEKIVNEDGGIVKNALVIVNDAEEGLLVGSLRVPWRHAEPDVEPHAEPAPPSTFVYPGYNPEEAQEFLASRWLDAVNDPEATVYTPYEGESGAEVAEGRADVEATGAVGNNSGERRRGGRGGGRRRRR